MAKNISVFMGIETEYDPVVDRNVLQKRAEKGSLTARGYWYNLVASWEHMTIKDREEDINNCY